MTKRGIVRAGLWALAVVVLFVGAAGGFAFCLLHKFNPDPPSNNFPKPANALEAQQQDIEQFSRLLSMDRSFSPAARAEAHRQIAELKSEQAPLDRERFYVALLRITALADNGHTNLHYGKDGSCRVWVFHFIGTHLQNFSMYLKALWLLDIGTTRVSLSGTRVKPGRVWWCSPTRLTRSSTRVSVHAAF
jgi:hypothetical protein